MIRSAIFAFCFCLASLVIFRHSFSNFFTQDDFILIVNFSSGSLYLDILNLFKFPSVSHFRPIDNLYFLFTGNLFYKKYILYHLLNYMILILTSFMIYKVSINILKSKSVALTSTFLFSIHSSHFISLFWISGSTILVGFLLFLVSFYFYLSKRYVYCLLFFILSFLASESMVFMLIIYIFCELSSKKLKRSFVISLILISTLFVFVRFVFLYGAKNSQEYQLEIGFKNLKTLYFYLFSVLGFADAQKSLLLKMISTGWLLSVIFMFINKSRKVPLRLVIKYGVITISGLFPFLLIPEHIAQNYVVISVWGFVSMISLLISKYNRILQFIFLGLFFLLSYINVNSMQQQSWITKRSLVAKSYLLQIQKQDLPNGSKIVFDDGDSKSQEAYFSLGGGKALEFYFKDKNYKSCFTVFERCN